MDHHFNIEIAQQYGINAAILLHNITYWIEKNKSEKRHFHEGRYWTYMSKSGLAELFPYMTARQIDYALNKLLDAGLILTGNFSEHTFDKTKWYALADSEEKEPEQVTPENSFSSVELMPCANGEKPSETAQLPIAQNSSNRLNNNVQSIEQNRGNRLNNSVQSLNSNINNNIYITNKKHTDKNPNNIGDVGNAVPEEQHLKDKDLEKVIQTIDDRELRDELREFVRMRIKNKRPPTPHAVELIIGKLQKMSGDKSEQLMILQQSTENGWLGLWELKNPPPTNAGTEMQPTENISELEKQFMQSYETD